jgi:hypothetical protein
MCFPLSGVSQKQPHCRFVHEVRSDNQVLDGIPGPLYSPKITSQMGLYRGWEGKTHRQGLHRKHRSSVAVELLRLCLFAELFLSKGCCIVAVVG